MIGSRPTASIIIPTYRRAAKTWRAVRSVLSQGVADVEIVVVDDGSPEVLTVPGELSADKRITVIRHSDNRGAAAARNTGVAHARGNWLAFLDSDDVWLPATFAARLQNASDHYTKATTSPAAHVCSWRDVDELAKPLRIRRPRPPRQPSHFAAGCWFSPGSTLIIRRDVFLRVGNQDEQLSRLEDYDWFLRFALSGGILLVHDIVAVEIETGKNPPADKTLKSVALLRAKWRDARADALPPAFTRLFEAYLELESGRAVYGRGEHRAALFHLARSWLQAPRLKLPVCPGWVIEKAR